MATAKKSGLRSEKGGERIAVYVDPAIAKSLRIHCAGERISLSAFVSDAIKEALKARKKRG
jgi:predicted HicB family RNase H-like nuclease